MKEYMPNGNRLLGSEKLAEGLLIYKIGMSFASTTKLFKILIKNIKQHFKMVKSRPWPVLIKTLLAKSYLLSLSFKEVNI